MILCPKIGFNRIDGAIFWIPGGRRFNTDSCITQGLSLLPSGRVCSAKADAVAGKIKANIAPHSRTIDVVILEELTFKRTSSRFCSVV